MGQGCFIMKCHCLKEETGKAGLSVLLLAIRNVVCLTSEKQRSDLGAAVIAFLE